MNRKKNLMLIDGRNQEMIRVAIVNSNNNQLYDLDYYNEFEYGNGSVHLGVVERVFPSLQAVFVKYKADGKNGFLPFSEIDPNYLSNNIVNHDLVEGEFIDTELLSYSVKNDLDGVDFNDDIDDESIHGKGFICKNQPIIVQVMKEERGTKGAMLSTFIHLDGQYCTFIPNRSDKSGISLNNISLIEKKRLQVLLQNLEIPEFGSVIINSGCFSASMNEVQEDLNKLVETWNSIKRKACGDAKDQSNEDGDYNLQLVSDNVVKISDLSAKNNGSPYRVLHYDFNLVKDIFYDKGGMYFHGIIIDSVTIYQEVVKFLKEYMPHFSNLVKLHDEMKPVFSAYGVEKIIDNQLSNIVSLKSGGYIVINITEALVSIDVNSGKNREEVSIEETAFKTNLEAVQEVFHQVKLRKLSGLIVVDLIGMRDYENNKAVEGIARRIVHSDKSQISIVPEFSILIISKQRLERNLHEIRDVKCGHCNGFGFIKNIKFNIYEIFNEIRLQFDCNTKANFKIIGSSQIIELLMNDYRSQISDLEREVSSKILLNIDSQMTDYEYRVEKIMISQIVPIVEKIQETVAQNFADVIVNEEVFDDKSYIENKAYNLERDFFSGEIGLYGDRELKGNFAQDSSINGSFNNKANKLDDEKLQNYKNYNNKKIVNTTNQTRRNIDKSIVVADNELLCVWSEWIEYLEKRDA